MPSRARLRLCARALVCLSCNNTLGVVDLASGELKSQIEVGIAPFAVALSPDGATAYVTDWGGRRVLAGEPSASSAGTPVLIDPRGIASSGGVSFVDLAAGTQSAYVETGLSACGLAVSPDGSRVYVANANHDTVSVVDSAHRAVVEQIVIKPDPALPFGSMPNGLAIAADGRTLFASCAGSNAVAVVDVQPEGPSPIRGWIPTGWYPGAVVAEGGVLMVANIKGVGSRSPRQEDGSFNSHRSRGTVQRTPIPDGAALEALTRQVVADARIPEALRAVERREQSAQAPSVPVPASPGRPSVLDHIFYVIKENCTYDQVFGDLASGDHPRGNGDPRLCVYGREATPNQHALAEQFVLLDNFYCNGVLSADGHSWVTEGNVTPYLERSFGGFARSYTFGDDPLTYSSSGFIWDHTLPTGTNGSAHTPFFVRGSGSRRVVIDDSPVGLPDRPASTFRVIRCPMQRRTLLADSVRLRPIGAGDLPALFEMQADPESNDMAGTKPRSREVFFAAWERHLADPGVNSRVIEIDGVIVGSISRFQADGHDCVGYWIAREHWGKGVASRALTMFLGEEGRRPLHATAASANAPSRRILEKCGFRCVGLRTGEETERFVAREIADFVLD